MPKKSPMIRPCRVNRFAVAGALLLAVALAAGCNWIGYGAHVIAGGEKSQRVWYDAEYDGLAGKSVAVLVSADDFTLYHHPNAPADTCRAVGARLAADIEGVTIADPKQTMQFQYRNPYWSTLPYGQLLEQLDVERIVHVDLVQYATHEPGNNNLWRGVVVANINVASADAPNPHDLVYANTVRVTFPPDRPIGVLDADDQTIQLGMLSLLSSEVARLFHGHERREPR